jgi:hypothetical protein
MRKITSMFAAMFGAAVLIGSNAPAEARSDCQQFLHTVDWYESQLAGVTRHPKEAEFHGRIRVAKERYKACMGADSESRQHRRRREVQRDIDTLLGIGGGIYIGGGSARGSGGRH